MVGTLARSLGRRFESGRMQRRVFVFTLAALACAASTNAVRAETDNTLVGQVRGIRMDRITVFDPVAKSATSFTLDKSTPVTTYDGKKATLDDVKVGATITVHYVKRQVLSLQRVSSIVLMPAGTGGTPLPIPSYSYAPSK